MKKFKFRYENILKLKIDLEEDIKNKLKELNHQRTLLEIELEEYKYNFRLYQETLNEKMSYGISGTELRMVGTHQEYYRRHIEWTISRIQTLDVTIEEVKQELLEAIKERKIMEKIREKDYKIYMDEMNVYERKITDEIVNFQNSKRSGD